MSHANARLAPAGRPMMVRRIHLGRAAAHVAAEMGCLSNDGMAVVAPLP